MKLIFTNYPHPNVLPPQTVRAPKETTAFEFLQRASELNPCYIFKYIQYSFGRYITTICGVKENKKTNFYWFIYLNGNLSPVGADLLKPKNGDTLKFEYQVWKHHNHKTSIKITAKPSDSHTIPNTAESPSTVSGKGHQISAPSLKIVISMAIGILAWKQF